MTTETVNLFEVAVRQKLRFESQVGALSAEDLWDLPLSSASKVSLDKLAVALNKQLKGNEESFVSDAKKDVVTQLKFDIVKHVIDTKVEENRIKTEAIKRKSEIQNIDQLIADKESEKLKSLTIEQLKAIRDSI